MYAAQQNQAASVRQLIDAGAKLETKDFVRRPKWKHAFMSIAVACPADIFACSIRHSHLI